MNYISLKFQCRVLDLVNAVKSHGDVKNIVIEDDNDAIGTINFLLGLIYDGRENPCNQSTINAECKMSGETIIVELKAEKYYQDSFTACVKKLQKLITSNKKEV